MTASTLVHSIAEMAGDPDASDFSNTKLKRLASIQLQVTGLLNDALGEARSRAEEDGDPT